MDNIERLLRRITDLETRLAAVRSDRDLWQKAVFAARDALLTAELSPMTALEILNKATGRG